MSAALADLLALMARLRAPDGCAWDREQTFASIAPYTIEEAYEVADAIERGDMAALKDELGDLLFQVVFHSRMSEESGGFAFEDVAAAIVAKMIRRHPHVFGDAGPRSSAEQALAWEEIKAAERAEASPNRRLLAEIPKGMPALLRAAKIQKRVSRAGFDWPDASHVVAKLDEEIGELKRAVAEGAPAREIELEIGDVLFVVANLALKLGADAEAALRATNAKFERRFAFVEDRLADRGRSPESSDLAEMDALWDEAKAAGL